MGANDKGTPTVYIRTKRQAWLHLILLAWTVGFFGFWLAMMVGMLRTSGDRSTAPNAVSAALFFFFFVGIAALFFFSWGIAIRVAKERKTTLFRNYEILYEAQWALYGRAFRQSADLLGWGSKGRVAYVTFLGALVGGFYLLNANFGGF